MDELTPRVRRRIVRAIKRRDLELVLALPPDQAVEQRVSLPLAAQEDVSGVLTFEFDRLTPFGAGEVYAAHRVTGRNEAAGRLDITLVYARRDRLAPLLSEAAALGFGPLSRLDVLRADEMPAGLDLMAGDRRKHFGTRRMLTVALSATSALLALVYSGLTFHAQEDKAERLRTAVSEAREVARAVENATRREYSADLAAFEAHASIQAPGAIVAALTALLPDDTYLERLTIEGDWVEAVGLSARATALVGLFDDDPRFKDPRYAAPITQTVTGDARFQIEARFMRADDTP
ncbi:MAG: PilN domain-containing protein [Pseudomonadota bacterium]